MQGEESTARVIIAPDQKTQDFIDFLIKCSDNPTAENIANFYNKFNSKLDMIKKDLESADIDHKVMDSVTEVFEKISQAVGNSNQATNEQIEKLQSTIVDKITYKLPNAIAKILSDGKNQDRIKFTSKLEKMSSGAKSHREKLNKAKDGTIDLWRR